MTRSPVGSSVEALRVQGADGGSSARKLKPIFGPVHRALRAATWNHHALIDRMLLQFDLTIPGDYRLLLNIHFDALQILERTWRLEDRADFSEMLNCLRDDLGALGETKSSAPIPSYLVASHSDGLGIGYVIRGSRRGAEVLRRRLPKAAPTRYMDLLPAITWPQFLTQLESAAEHPGGSEEAIHAARRTFDTFITEFNLGLAPTAFS
jgi:heme oxygenase